MPNIDVILIHLSGHPTSDDLRLVAFALGEWMVAREDAPLSACYDRLRVLQRELSASPLVGYLDGMATTLEAYFASVETVKRTERLASEVASEQVWHSLLEALAREAGNQEYLCDALDRGKSTVSVACNDLRQRELIELVPSASRRENVHALTRDGRAVLAKLRATARATSSTRPAPSHRPATTTTATMTAETTTTRTAETTTRTAETTAAGAGAPTAAPSPSSQTATPPPGRGRKPSMPPVNAQRKVGFAQ
jgi:DNA-binding MarR family transcriptional regulator